MPRRDKMTEEAFQGVLTKALDEAALMLDAAAATLAPDEKADRVLLAASVLGTMLEVPPAPLLNLLDKLTREDLVDLTRESVASSVLRVLTPTLFWAQTRAFLLGWASGRVSK